MSVKPRQRILVMRYRFIGDTLLTVPFLRNLRAAYPNAKIDMLVAPNSGEVLRDCPYIDELIMFDTTRKHRYENPNGVTRRKNFWHYVGLLRKRRYDTAFVLKRSLSSAALAFLASIPERIGFDTEGRGFLLTRRVPYVSGMHEVDSFLSILEAAGIPVHDRYLEAWWQAPESEKAGKTLQNAIQKTEEPDRTLTLSHVALHLTSSNRAKEWPQAHALRFANWLLSREDRHVHCLGAQSDAARYEALKAQLPPERQQRLHIHCGQLDLLSSMAFLRHMDWIVGVDSGTLHMAAAVGIPVVALFGPMDERRWQPPGATVVANPLACRPCELKRPCHRQFECITGLTPEAVIEKVQHAGLS
jgi:heptosyltransferase-2